MKHPSLTALLRSRIEERKKVEQKLGNADNQQSKRVSAEEERQQRQRRQGQKKNVENRDQVLVGTLTGIVTEETNKESERECEKEIEREAEINHRTNKAR